MVFDATCASNRGSPNVSLLLRPEHHSRPEINRTVQADRTKVRDVDVVLEEEKTRWMCHKAILAEHSPYFDAIFRGDFKESDAAIVVMPPGIFTANSIDGLLQYMYTGELVVYANGTSNEANDATRQLQDMYFAADYLRMTTCCRQIASRLADMVHNWTCYCDECRDNVIQLFAFTYSRSQQCLEDECLTDMTDKAIAILTHEPDKVLHTYWTSPLLANVLNAHPELEQRLGRQLLSNISRFNAIETLHACYVATECGNLYRLLQTIVGFAQSRATELVAAHFNFYCSQYPTLLSCIDGISYSFDFLEYLLHQVLKNQMNEQNALIMYQSVVRDLMSRHAVQQCDKVRDILNDARKRILRFIVNNIEYIAQNDGFSVLDKNVYQALIQEAGLPIKYFAKPSETSNSNNISFNTGPRAASRKLSGIFRRTSVDIVNPCLVGNAKHHDDNTNTSNQLTRKLLDMLFFRRKSSPAETTEIKQKHGNAELDKRSDNYIRQSRKKINSSPIGSRRIQLTGRPVLSS